MFHTLQWSRLSDCILITRYGLYYIVKSGFDNSISDFTFVILVSLCFTPCSGQGCLIAFLISDMDLYKIVKLYFDNSTSDFTFVILVCLRFTPCSDQGCQICS